LLIRWLSQSKPPSPLAFSYGRFDASTSSTTTYISETLLHDASVVEPVETTVSITSVAEPVEATTARLFPQRAFRCFDRLSNHKLNDRISVCRTFRWLSLSKPPSSLAFSYGRFDASTGSATTSSITTYISETLLHYASVVEPVETITARLFPQRAFRCFDRLSNHKLNDRISACRTFRWLSLSKPPSSLAFSCGRFDASTGSASSTTAFPLAELSVVEPVEATTARLFPQRSFRCFDRLSNHKLNDRISVCRTFRWLSLSKPPLQDFSLSGRFDASTGSASTNPTTAYISETLLHEASVVEPVETTTARLFPQRAFRCFDRLSNHKLNGRLVLARHLCTTLRWLSQSKPPSSLAFSYGRFDASTGSASSTTTCHQV